MKHRKDKQPRHETDAIPTDADISEVRQTADALQSERDELFEKLQRVSADYANFQKRVPKQVADTVAYEKERIIKTLLPVLDSLEHTLQNGVSADNVEAFVKGVRIVYDQVLDIFKSLGVERIEAAGQVFDPSMHEAMLRRADPDQAEDLVLEEFQKGYRLNGRVIRPSKVIVNKPAAERPAEDLQSRANKPDSEHDRLEDATEHSDAADTE